MLRRTIHMMPVTFSSNVTMALRSEHHHMHQSLNAKSNILMHTIHMHFVKRVRLACCHIGSTRFGSNQASVIINVWV